jgi:hypothetical protein
LKEKEERIRRSKRKSSGSLPDGMEALISLFKDQLISCKAGKIWAVLREGIGWLQEYLTQSYHIIRGILLIFGL